MKVLAKLNELLSLSFSLPNVFHFQPFSLVYENIYACTKKKKQAKHNSHQSLKQIWIKMCVCFVFVVETKTYSLKPK